MNSVLALLSNPAPPPPSAGNLSAGREATPKRSRMVLPFEAADWWRTTRPDLESPLLEVIQLMVDPVNQAIAFFRRWLGFAIGRHIPLPQLGEGGLPKPRIAPDTGFVFELLQVDPALWFRWAVTLVAILVKQRLDILSEGELLFGGCEVERSGQCGEDKKETNARQPTAILDLDESLSARGCNDSFSTGQMAFVRIDQV
jgi:hypothetical protein